MERDRIAEGLFAGFSAGFMETRPVWTGVWGAPPGRWNRAAPLEELLTPAGRSDPRAGSEKRPRSISALADLRARQPDLRRRLSHLPRKPVSATGRPAKIWVPINQPNCLCRNKTGKIYIRYLMAPRMVSHKMLPSAAPMPMPRGASSAPGSSAKMGSGLLSRRPLPTCNMSLYLPDDVEPAPCGIIG